MRARGFTKMPGGHFCTSAVARATELARRGEASLALKTKLCFFGINCAHVNDFFLLNNIFVRIKIVLNYCDLKLLRLILYNFNIPDIIKSQCMSLLSRIFWNRHESKIHSVHSGIPRTSTYNISISVTLKLNLPMKTKVCPFTILFSSYNILSKT
ncbi:MAG: hypothetical protein EBX52_12295 [Proteobacteria bacterium]|nr:hypothetical protein [Pseudomonadota bacterium]